MFKGLKHFGYDKIKRLLYWLVPANGVSDKPPWLRARDPLDKIYTLTDHLKFKNMGQH